MGQTSLRNNLIVVLIYKYMQYVYVRWKCNRNVAGHHSSRERDKRIKGAVGELKHGTYALTWTFSHRN